MDLGITGKSFIVPVERTANRSMRGFAVRAAKALSSIDGASYGDVLHVEQIDTNGQYDIYEVVLEVGEGKCENVLPTTEYTGEGGPCDEPGTRITVDGETKVVCGPCRDGLGLLGAELGPVEAVLR